MRKGCRTFVREGASLPLTRFHFVATCNASNAKDFLDAFGNGQSFYREMFSEENVEALMGGLSGNPRLLEVVSGMQYCDRTGLREQISTLLYCALVFADARAMPRGVAKSVVRALRLPSGWKMGDTMPDEMDFLQRIDAFILPRDYVPFRLTSMDNLYDGTIPNTIISLRSSQKGVLTRFRYETYLRKARGEAESLPEGRGGKRKIADDDLPAYPIPSLWRLRGFR